MISGSNAYMYVNNNLVLTSSAYVPPSSKAITRFEVPFRGIIGADVANTAAYQSRAMLYIGHSHIFYEHKKVTRVFP